MKGNTVVYTALFGAYDELPELMFKPVNCDFICFTDQKDLKSSVWSFKYVEKEYSSNILMNRKYKMLPHIFLHEYENSLYIDANIFLKKEPYELVQNNLEHASFVVPEHNLRNCIYDEAKECLALGRASYHEVRCQLSKYTKVGMPKRYGLSENGIIVRKHNDKSVIKLMNEWWDEINTESQRDQLSLPFILWRNDTKFSFLNESLRVENDYFELRPHKLKRSFFQKLIFKLSSSSRRFILRFVRF